MDHHWTCLEDPSICTIEILQMLEYILEVPCCDQTALQYQNQLLGPNHVEKVLNIVIEYNLTFQ